MPRDCGGLIGEHDPHLRRGQVATIEDAKAQGLAAGGNCPPVTERVLSTHIERQVTSHLAPVPFEPRDQPSEVIEVTVTHNQGVDRCHVDLQDIEVIKEGRRCVAEVPGCPTWLAPPRGLQVKRQPEVVENLLAKRGAEDAAEPLDLDGADPATPDESS